MQSPAVSPAPVTRWNYVDRPAGTGLVVQRVDRLGDLFLYEVWCEKTHVLKSMTQKQIEALISVTGTPAAG